MTNDNKIEAVNLYNEKVFMDRELFQNRVAIYMVCIESDKVLLNTIPATGRFGFIGGEKEGYESHIDCLRREALEEIGTDKIEVGELIDVGYNPYHHDIANATFYSVAICYKGRILDRDAIDLTLCDEYEGPAVWKKISELKEADFPYFQTNGFMHMIQKALRM
jgi:8-oxo-dGTP pyrophosphatase MutT (NUDIX family)